MRLCTPGMVDEGTHCKHGCLGILLPLFSASFITKTSTNTNNSTNKRCLLYFICIEMIAKQTLSTMCYFRYAPAYWMEMQQLSSSHSWLYNQLVDNAGSWTTHQGVSGLSSMAADQTIETTINRSSKTSGGVRGVTLTEGN